MSSDPISEMRRRAEVAFASTSPPPGFSVAVTARPDEWHRYVDIRLLYNGQPVSFPNVVNLALHSADECFAQAEQIAIELATKASKGAPR